MNWRDPLTNTPSNVSDELYARLRNQFSEEQLMQLAAQIAFENYRARWNRLFNVESTIFIMDRRRRSVAMRYGRAGASQVCLNLS